MREMTMNNKRERVKTFIVTYKTEVKRKGTILAKNEEEARQKFDRGESSDEGEIYGDSIYDISIKEIM
jgi:hypothetical protein